MYSKELRQAKEAYNAAYQAFLFNANSTTSDNLELKFDSLIQISQLDVQLQLKKLLEKKCLLSLAEVEGFIDNLEQEVLRLTNLVEQKIWELDRYNTSGGRIDTN